MPNALIYARISKDKTGAGLGVDRQERDCRKLADRLGATVLDVYVDNDISAYGGKHRPGYRAMLDRMTQGGIDYVLCWATDRLHRRVDDLREYADISIKHGVLTHAVTAGIIDLSTGSGLFAAQINGAFAELESTRKSERVKAAQEQAARAGKWLGGRRPYGWAFEDGAPVIVDDEAERIRVMHDAVLSGQSIRSIVDGLNSAGALTSYDGHWTRNTVRQVLKRPRNAGLATYRGQILDGHASTFPAIVSEATHRAVVAKLTDPNRARSTSNRVKYLLSGIAQCECGRLMVKATVKPQATSLYRVYKCQASGRGHAHKKMEAADAHVLDVVTAILHSDAGLDATPSSNDDARQQLEDEAATLRQMTDEAADSRFRGTIDQRQMERITVPANARLADIERQLADLHAASQTPGVLSAEGRATLAAQWDTGDLEERRRILRAAFGVVITRTPPGAARRFEPSTVRIAVKANAGPLTPEQVETVVAAEVAAGQTSITLLP
ncbi:hypothetical protein BKD30_04120 [Tersicoccus phoenicis]|uniref:Serine recombinase n=1 Tax=Tersicoccus phoenicis TaxID=554083 RepID=A0A1R1LHU4_9MICC|nr:recombinase family protein [Tersicoccus phoenicis]OMH27080.1 hypothetical protein BKD30_04120 [Tersicoccus phoenicis]